MGGSLEIEAKPPQIGGGRYRARPSPHPEPPGTRAGRGGGEGRRIWGDSGRFGASGGGGSAGTPPDVACGHLPTPNPPPKTGGKPRPSGGFTDSAAFPPKKWC